MKKTKKGEGEEEEEGHASSKEILVTPGNNSSNIQASSKDRLVNPANYSPNMQIVKIVVKVDLKVGVLVSGRVGAGVLKQAGSSDPLPTQPVPTGKSTQVRPGLYPKRKDTRGMFQLWFDTLRQKGWNPA